MPSPVPTSATFAPARSPGAATGPGATATAVDDRPRPVRDPDDITDASDSPRTRERREYTLPGHALLDETVEPVAPGGEEAIHRRTEEIIIKKLASFEIQAQIVGRNAGPVVTQYEVQPAPHIKVSRIEALSDDLAMALAARTLRIEAPIPGKSAVGIEIPNQDFNVVTLRGILESLDFGASGSKLTFALGRDVAGRAQAVDLAKMPHLLIAGATGSGKSVMVNALITSLLCNASPDDVRMILVTSSGSSWRPTTACPTSSCRSSPSRSGPRRRSSGPSTRWRTATGASRARPPGTSAPTTTRAPTPRTGCRTSSSSSTSSPT